MKLRSVLFGIILAGLVLAAPLAAVAQEDNSTDNRDEQQTLNERQTHLEEKRRQAEERLEQVRARRCEFVKTRLTFHRDRAETIREHRKERYRRIVDRLNALADRMDANDMDSAALRVKIEELTRLVSAYSERFTDYETALQGALNVVCDDETISREAARVARQALVSLHSNAEAIHIFFRAELKPLLQEIRALVQASADNETREETN